MNLWKKWKEASAVDRMWWIAQAMLAVFIFGIVNLFYQCGRMNP